MILQTEIEEKKEELRTLRKDMRALNMGLRRSITSGDSDMVKEIQSKKKSLAQYINDLVEELSGMQNDFKHDGGADDEKEETYQKGSFGHSLLNSTILEDEEGLPDESGQADSLQIEEWPGGFGQEAQGGEPLPETEGYIEDAEGDQ